MAPRRGLARPRPTAPGPDVELSPLARRLIARGSITEPEYRERVRGIEERERADLISRMPPAVAAVGPAAVEEWVAEWRRIDRRRWPFRRADGDPRAPLPLVGP